MPRLRPSSASSRPFVALSSSKICCSSSSSSSQRRVNTESSCGEYLAGSRRWVSKRRSSVSGIITVAEDESASAPPCIEQTAHGIHRGLTSAQHVLKRGAAVEDGIAVGQLYPL